MIHCSKIHIFFVCLLFLLTITGGNKAITVELKVLFVLNGTFITFYKKMRPALAFNSIIIATNACRGMWYRHDVSLSDNFFYTRAIF